jgi:hypothetical protein
MHPRIYTYKITFVDTPYYYYGVHKEKRFNEEYWGSPVTHKWCWDFYEPKKQILEVFDYTTEGWVTAQQIEKKLIKPSYNIDKWCLNENVGGAISLSICSLNGKKAYEIKAGIHSWNKSQISKNSKQSGKKAYELGVGIHARTKEQMQEQGKINGNITYHLGTGIHAHTPEEKMKIAKLGGEKAYELGVGVHARTKEQMKEHGKKLYELGLGISTVSKEQLRENIKKVNSQKWKCLITGYISNPGGLTSYQRARGIDTSKRIKLSLEDGF